MRLFVIADTQLAIPRSLVLAKIQDIIHACAQNKEVQIIVVGESFPDHFIQYCNTQSLVKIQSNKAATAFSKQLTNEVLVHFGTHVKWAKGFSNFFIPLVLPAHLDGIGFIKRVLLKRKFNQWSKDATKLLAVNEWALSSLQPYLEQYNFPVQLINLPLVPAPHFEWNVLAATKEKLSMGNNYFLAFVPVARFTAILKEFSVFKKWQLTTMHLVFVFETEKEVEFAKAELRGYKFRQDISIYHLSAMSLAWLAAAYLILWEGIHFAKATWIEYAVEFDVPLLFDEAIHFPERWQNAGEVFSFSEKQALSNHFKLYYKDEVYRQSRASMGKEWLQMLRQNSSDQELFNKIVLSHNN
jgi:hypothetical protein